MQYAQGEMCQDELDFVSEDDKYRALERVVFEARLAAAVAATAEEDERELMEHRAAAVDVTNNLVAGFKAAQEKLVRARAGFAAGVQAIEADFKTFATRKDPVKKAVRGALKGRGGAEAPPPGAAAAAIAMGVVGSGGVPLRYESVQFRKLPDPKWVSAQVRRVSLCVGALDRCSRVCVRMWCGCVAV